MILILIFNISHKQHPYPTTYSQASSTYFVQDLFQKNLEDYNYATY